MSIDRHTKCCYCGVLYSLDAQEGQRHYQLHPSGCPNPPPYSNPDPLGRYTCYACGTTETTGRTGKKIKSRFTAAQRLRGVESRCKTCEAHCQNKRYPYFENKVWDDSLDQQLSACCQAPWRVKLIRKLLDEGADPNHIRQDRIRDSAVPSFVRGGPVYNGDGTPSPDDDANQPTRPLLSAVFSMSNSMFESNDHRRLAQVIKLLVDAGADVTPAVQYFEDRHGQLTPFPDRGWWISAQVLWKARNSIQHIHHMCVNQLDSEGEHNELFDFVEYFNRNDDDEAGSGHQLPLTERAVRASDVLRPFYDKYTLQRAECRLRSQRATYFRRPRRLDGSDVTLPSLPSQIEAQILALAFLSGPRPIFASHIPAPVSGYADADADERVE